MFSSQPLSLNAGQAKRFDTIMQLYQSLSNSDPQKLRELIPATEVWRFFIDGIEQRSEKKEAQGWIPFEEREENYLLALYTAFPEIFNLDQEPTRDLLKKLHKISTTKVKNTVYEKELTSGEFRDDSIPSVAYIVDKTFSSKFGLNEAVETLKTNHYFGLHFPDRNRNINMDIVFTPQTLADLRMYVEATKSESSLYSKEKFIEKMNLHLPSDFIAYINRLSEFSWQGILSEILSLGRTKNDKEYADTLWRIVDNHQMHHDAQVFFISHQPINTLETLNTDIQNAINEYYSKIKAADTNVKKLAPIISLVKRCENIHPFRDANGRTISMLFLNFLLMKNGLPLTILDNPNYIDMKSTKELIEEVIKGMENVMRLAQKQPIFNVTTQEVLAHLAKHPNKDELINYFNTLTALENTARNAANHRPTFNADKS